MSKTILSRGALLHVVLSALLVFPVSPQSAAALSMSWSCDRRERNLTINPTLSSMWSDTAQAGVNLRQAYEDAKFDPGCLGSAYYGGAITNYRVGRLRQADLLFGKCIETYETSKVWQIPIGRREGQDINLFCALGKKVEAKKLLSIITEQHLNPQDHFVDPDAFDKVALMDVPPDSDVVACWNAINRSDSETARSLLVGMFERLEKQQSSAIIATNHIQLTAVLFNASVELADHRMFELSSWTLTRLNEIAQKQQRSADDSTTDINLRAEMLYQSYVADRDDKNTRLTDLFKLPTVDCTPSELLRQLGVLHYFAGDLNRADFFLREAISVSATGEPTSDNAALMLIDAACVNAKQGKLDLAEQLWKRAQALPVVADANLEFNFRRTSVELATCFMELDRRSQAEDVLVATLARQAMPVEKDDRNYGESEVAIKLARLFFDDNQPKKGLEVIQQFIRPDAYLRSSQHMIVAQCAEAASDFNFAATHYAVRKQYYDTNPSIADYIKESSNFRKALKLASRAHLVDKKLVAKISFELANLLSYEPEKCREQQALYKRALSLSKKSDKDYEHYEKAVASLSANGERRFALKSLSKAETEDAKLSQCIELASLALQRKQIAVSVRWVEAGIQHFAKATDAPTSFLPWGELYLDHLTRENYGKDAEKLLLLALSSTEAQKEKDSAKIAGECYLLFRFLAKQNREQESLSYLDRALNCDLTEGFSRYSNTCWTPPAVPQDGAMIALKIIKACNELGKSNPTLAKESLTRLLAAQQRVLPAESIGVTNTKNALSQFEQTSAP